MTTPNLPAVRQTGALATRQTSRPPSARPLPALRLSTALFVVCVVAGGLAAVAFAAQPGRLIQAALLGVAALALLVVGFVERRREARR